MDLPFSSESFPSGGELQMGNAEESAFWLIGQALDFPTVSEHDLLDDRQTQAGALLLGSEIGFENFDAPVGGDPRTVIPDFQRCFGSAGFLGKNLDFARAINGLHCI